MKQCPIYAFVLFLCCALTNNVGGQTPTPESLRNAVVAALESKWIVAIGENHGHVELHKLLCDLLTDSTSLEGIRNQEVLNESLQEVIS